jgi:two-component system cell cycle sensor histidine kinase PleC
MRSSETSDADVPGFRVGKIEREPSRRSCSQRSGEASPSRRITSLTMAVTVTALLSALLFITVDATQSWRKEIERLDLIAAVLVANTADTPQARVAETAQALVGRLGQGLTARLISTPAEVGAPISRLVTLPGDVLMALEAAHDVALTGVALRGGAALALAGAAIFLSLRRTRRGMPSRQERENYETLAAAIPLGVACWTKAGEMIVCNERYRERVELWGNAVTYQRAVARLIAGGYMKLIRDDDSNRVLELHRQDGSCLMIDERPLGDGAFMTLVSDITERKKSDALLDALREDHRFLIRRYHEEKLRAEAASHAKSNFLAHLSHDIRTPLNHIIGFADLMSHEAYGTLGDARYLDYVRSIKQSGEHLLASFGTILELTEMVSGQKVLRSDPVPVEEILDAVARRFVPTMAKAGIGLRRGPPSPTIIAGDRLVLDRMISNIVENAIRFTPAGGEIALVAHGGQNGVVIEITDTGIGMTADRLGSLSQPFALGDATFTREGVGQGLGVSIARAIAERSGGRLMIDSTPDVGTTVAIALPARAAGLDRVAA